MPQPWIVRPPVTPSPELMAAVGGSPLVARLLAQRGIDTPAKAIPFLDPDRYTPAPPAALAGVAEAAQLLHAALARGERLLVWGDFDVDGQTSTSLLVTALRTLAGDERVRFHVPNRFDEGHGIKVDKLRAVLQAAEDEGAPIDVLLSCDTGIAEGPAVGFAKDRGLTVVITDHHDLPADLQAKLQAGEPLWGQPGVSAGAQSVRRADAVVNPKFLPPGDRLRTLPGVGVAFKLVQELYALAGRTGEEDELLDLVALGIVADVAEQVHDARYLLQRGLARLRATRRVGLLGLMNIARIEPAALTADSIGYQLGPRMNALGRLEDATVSVELLTTRDALRAGQLAAKLERLNQDRRQLTTQTFIAATEMIDRDPRLLEFNALVLAHPNWHAGVVGIVASKLVEQFGKPTVLLLTPPAAPGEPALPARGSARSVPGVDIGAAIAACASLLLSHGGHPGAAGLSLPAQNIDAFRRELSRQVERHRDETVRVGLQIDAEAHLPDLSLDLAAELTRLAPFGQGNPTPQFVSYGLQVVDDRRIGREGTHRKLTVRGSDDERATLPVLWFGGADAELPAGPIDLVYTLNVNEFKGERTLQLLYVDSRGAQGQAAVAVQPTWQAPKVVDLRGLPEAELLAAVPGPAAAAWFAEGVKLSKELAPSPRGDLLAGGARPALVFYSIPPSAELLHWAIDTVRPQTIYLCGRSTAEDGAPEVLRAVAGMCKYALNTGGAAGPGGAQPATLDVNRMAARLGITEAVVRQALLWLEARGDLLLLEWQAGDAVRVAQGDGQPRREAIHQLENEIHWLLAEIRAYRRFFQRVKVQEIGAGDA